MRVDLIGGVIRAKRVVTEIVTLVGSHKWNQLITLCTKNVFDGCVNDLVRHTKLNVRFITHLGVYEGNASRFDVSCMFDVIGSRRIDVWYFCVCANG